MLAYFFLILAVFFAFASWTAKNPENFGLCAALAGIFLFLGGLCANSGI